MSRRGGADKRVVGEGLDRVRVGRVRSQTIVIDCVARRCRDTSGTTENVVSGRVCDGVPRDLDVGGGVFAGELKGGGCCTPCPDAELRGADGADVISHGGNRFDRGTLAQRERPGVPRAGRCRLAAVKGVEDIGACGRRRDRYRLCRGEGTRRGR